MESKVVEQYGEQLTDKWGEEALGPLLFLLAGGAAYIVHHGPDTLARKIEQATLGERIVQGAALAGALLALILLCRAATPYALRLLEGYWTGPLDRLRRRRIAALRARWNRNERRWQNLAGEPARTPQEGGEYALLDRWLNEHPAPDFLMPTRAGNILRAAERRPGDKYGLDAIVCWPRLWLVVPDETRKALAEAREKLDDSARMWLLGALAIVWTVFTPWTVPAVIAVCAAAQVFLLDAARVYASLVESAFDMHRSKLYEALRWPTPGNPAEEIDSGRRLTEYLLRGSNDPNIVFEPKPPPETKPA